MIATKQKMHNLLLKWQDDPIGFYRQVLGVPAKHLWSKPVAVAESVAAHQLTAVPAGHSVSKTWNAGKLVCWYKTCFRPSTVITTAPSDNQVRNQLWREISATYQGSRIPLGGKLNTLQWDMRLPPAQLEALEREDRDMFSLDFAIGFSTSPDAASTHATKMQGWHNRYMLVILDEACGLQPQIWKTVLDSLIINPRCRVLAIGNPTDPESQFADVCRLDGRLDHLEEDSSEYESDMGWHVVPVSVTDTPNYIKGREIVPNVAGRDFEDLILKRYQVGSDGWKIRVRGAFPTTREGTFYGKEIATARKEGRIGAYPYDPSHPVYRFADFGDVYTGCIDVQFIRGRIRIINDYWDNAGESHSHGGTVPVDGQGAFGCVKSMQAMPYVWGKEHFAGPDLEGSNRQSFAASGTPTKDILRGLGYNFHGCKKESFHDGIEAVRMIWRLLEIDEQGAATFIKAISGYHKRKNEAMSTSEQPVYHTDPAKSWHRHLADALRHLAVQYRYGTIGDDYLGDAESPAAWQHASPSAATNPYRNRKKRSRLYGGSRRRR